MVVSAAIAFAPDMRAQDAAERLALVRKGLMWDKGRAEWETSLGDGIAFDIAGWPVDSPGEARDRRRREIRRSLAHLEASERIAKSELANAERLPSARSVAAVCLLLCGATLLITGLIGFRIESRRIELRPVVAARPARQPDWGD